MPMKLIGFILFIVVIFAFIGFNLDNTTNINIWINEKGHFENVSVIIVVFAAYLFGLISTVPFWFARTLARGKKKSRKEEKGEKAALPPAPVQKEKRKRLTSRKKDEGEENGDDA
ncbi:MAG: hypothetical protein JXA95_13570 [Spirochaetales bacterium]|nr:hypothetical protein [Spirochaetales bacterium]